MERWVVAAKRADFAAIGKEFGIDPVIARLIRNRDVQDRDEIRRYLYGKVDELASPHLMKDVDKAVVVVYPEDIYSEDQILNLVESGEIDKKADISALVQDVIFK